MKIQFNRLLVSIIGIILITGAGFAIWHWVITPAQEVLKQKEGEYEAVRMYDDKKLADTRIYKENEFAKLALDEALYDEYMSRFMPMLDFGRRDVGMIAYWHEATGAGSTIVTNFAMKDPIVKVLSASLSVPPPPTNPNDSLFDQKVIVYSGNVNVEGDFGSILNNLTRWSNAPRLVLVNPSITMNMNGNDPNKVSASYAITCYVFPRSTGGANVSMAPAGAGGMSGSMRPGGMPGMPGAMPGMPSPGGMPGGMSSPMMPNSATSPPATTRR